MRNENIRNRDMILLQQKSLYFSERTSIFKCRKETIYSYKSFKKRKTSGVFIGNLFKYESIITLFKGVINLPRGESFMKICKIIDFYRQA